MWDRPTEPAVQPTAKTAAAEGGLGSGGAAVMAALAAADPSVIGPTLMKRACAPPLRIPLDCMDVEGEVRESGGDDGESCDRGGGRG